MGKNINDKLFDFVYTMAFRDATMRNAFPRINEELFYDKKNKTDKEKADNLYHERKNQVKDHSRAIVRTYIDNIMGQGEIPDPIGAIVNLCDEYNTSRGFTFGNAQKLLNMTAKYMFLSTFDNEHKRERFQRCHCPMDSVMITKVREENLNTQLSRDLSWSRLELINHIVPEDYLVFQKEIEALRKTAGNEGKGQKLMPIEIDFLYWDV